MAVKRLAHLTATGLDFGILFLWGISALTVRSLDWLQRGGAGHGRTISSGIAQPFWSRAGSQYFYEFASTFFEARIVSEPQPIEGWKLEGVLLPKAFSNEKYTLIMTHHSWSFLNFGVYFSCRLGALAECSLGILDSCISDFSSNQTRSHPVISLQCWHLPFSGGIDFSRQTKRLRLGSF